jgi:uncharacterized DUF497 family protein
MEIEYDTAKEAANIIKHDMSLADAQGLFEGSIKVRPDDRKNYGEQRMIALGEIAGRVHVCVYTMRGDVYRVISLRRTSRGATGLKATP